ncbi:hypothetical protein GCK32_021707 [Trichostrongylus colubriformis]|uniref:Uncharacterized protein n=1 Tax=Trichostrongylus colubriformis TaxID=6319 RepID=A0AAN8F5P6_TRICO
MYDCRTSDQAVQGSSNWRDKVQNTEDQGTEVCTRLIETELVTVPSDQIEKAVSAIRKVGPKIRGERPMQGDHRANGTRHRSRDAGAAGQASKGQKKVPMNCRMMS